ncbi:hypothetical protein IWX48DRAFT_614033 [Phyllosticta citricarpa]
MSECVCALLLHTLCPTPHSLITHTCLLPLLHSSCPRLSSHQYASPIHPLSSSPPPMPPRTIHWARGTNGRYSEHIYLRTRLISPTAARGTCLNDSHAHQKRFTHPLDSLYIPLILICIIYHRRRRRLETCPLTHGEKRKGARDIPPLLHHYVTASRYVHTFLANVRYECSGDEPKDRIIKVCWWSSATHRSAAVVGTSI